MCAAGTSWRWWTPTRRSWMWSPSRRGSSPNCSWTSAKPYRWAPRWPGSRRPRPRWGPHVMRRRRHLLSGAGPQRPGKRHRSLLRSLHRCGIWHTGWASTRPDPRHRQGRRHHAGRRGARRGRQAGRGPRPVLAAGQASRRRARRRAGRRQRHRTGGCRDRGGRAARRGPPPRVRSAGSRGRTAPEAPPGSRPGSQLPGSRPQLPRCPGKPRRPASAWPPCAVPSGP